MMFHALHAIELALWTCYDVVVIRIHAITLFFDKTLSPSLVKPFASP